MFLLIQWFIFHSIKNHNDVGGITPTLALISRMAPEVCHVLKYQRIDKNSIVLDIGGRIFQQDNH